MSDSPHPALALSTRPRAVSAGTAESLVRIVDCLPEALACINRQWYFTYANAESIRISRLDPELFATRTHWELFPDTVGTELERRYRGVMETGRPDRYELYYEAFAVYYDIHILPSVDGIVLYYRDSTSQRTAERREQETARQLAQVLELTTDAILTLDRHWTIGFLNGHAREMLDPDGRLLGTNLWEAFPAARHSPVWENCHRCRDEGVPTNFEFYYPEPLNAWFGVRTQPASDGIVAFFRDITEQKTHEQVVRGQQEMLEVVQRAARAATWELDLATGRFDYGPGSFSVFGHSLEAVPDLPSLEAILLRGHAQALRHSITEASKTGDSVVFDFAVKALDGSTLWIEARGQAVVRTDSASRLRGMFIDITQRKLNEEKLVTSESRYRVLTDLNPQSIWMGDRQGNIIYANQGFLAYIGLAPEDIGGRGWLTPFALEDQDRVVEAWTASVATGADYDIEARLCNVATKQYRWWHLRAAPVRDAAGDILHWLGVANDIHEAKTYAETLRGEQVETERQRAELESIYKTAPVGLALIDPVDLKFLNLNDREAERLGLPKERVIGRPISELAPPDKVPELLELMRSVVRGAEVTDRLLEGALASRPGEARAWSVNYSPVYNEEGSIRAISTASIEVTNQKKAEAALIQSEKLAAVGRLASSISHEINNPLEAITNLLYLVALDETLPEPLKLYVHMAQSELSRVSQIATQTLRFHRQAVAPTLVTAGDLVDAVVRLYTGRLANSNIKVDARYDTTTAILCFENDIRQVLNNLIANAIDAMRKGGQLIVRAHQAHDRSRQLSRPGVRIVIADTGHGMNPAVQARIFEPFFTTKDLQGTGLGLWISKGIVERHQGRLQVRSSDDPGRHGTVFTLFLPCAEMPPA